jgi:hypothetical protein
MGVTCIGIRSVDAVGRNPDASGEFLVRPILGMALAESIAFYELFLSSFQRPWPKLWTFDFASLFAKFSVDWYLLFIQSLNFLLVSFLLDKFGLKCVIETMAEGRQKYNLGRHMLTKYKKK